MLKLLCTLVLFGGIAHASTSYDCGALKISVGSDKIKVLGISGHRDKVVVGTKTTFRPTAKNAGSSRFDISSICESSGSVYLILDKDLTLGKGSGRMTLQSSCDADGGMPSFDRYNCRAK